MRSLRLFALLLGALVIHAAGARLWGGFPRAVDLFLVAVVLHALEGTPVSAMFAGLIAGLLTDALSGGLYGLHGFADTILGYASAFLAQRLVMRRLLSLLLLFSLAAAAQQAILLGLSLLLVSSPGLPDLTWTLVRVATSGLVGTALFAIGRAGRTRMAKWRRGRQSRLR